MALRRVTTPAVAWHLGLAVACLGYASTAFLVAGPAAFAVGAGRGWPAPTAAGCGLALALVLLLTAELERRGVAAWARGLAVCGAMVAVLGVAVPAGVPSAAWWLVPVATLVAGGLGAVPWWIATALGLAGVAAAAWVQGNDTPVLVAVALVSTGAIGLWGHTARQRAARRHRDSLAETVDALRERERLLGHAMRVETVGDLAGMVAHQLRNNLQVMMGQAALGARAAAADKDRRFAKIREGIASSTLLLEQLLELAHPDEGAPRRVDLRRLCAEFRDSASRILPATIAFEARLPEHPVPVALDPRGLEHALLNLVINARHAMDGQGALELLLEVSGDVARIAVRDSGAGIEPDVLARIFEPYFTTKPKGQGTGLGLAAVERYVRSADGRVRVESEVGVGTTFWLEFPWRRGHDVSVATKRSAS